MALLWISLDDYIKMLCEYSFPSQGLCELFGVLVAFIQVGCFLVELVCNSRVSQRVLADCQARQGVRVFASGHVYGAFPGFSCVFVIVVAEEAEAEVEMPLRSLGVSPLSRATKRRCRARPAVLPALSSKVRRS